MEIYKCKHCGKIIDFEPYEFNGDGYFHLDGEELLWGHIQFDHKDVYMEVQNMETPFMIEECYELFIKDGE